MKNLKTLLCAALVLCMAATLCVPAFAAETEAPADPAAAAEPMIDSENDLLIPDATHLDVKADAKYVAVVDGEEVVLDATLVPETIVVTVDSIIGPINYKFADYHVFTEHEAGRTEYRIILDVSDGSGLELIDWDGVSFRMENVYISARFVFEDVPEVLAAEMEQDENGNYYLDVENYRYTGIQECTSHNGLRSEGNAGFCSGVDLYITASGLNVTTPETEPETTEPETTEPETTEPETTEPETTEPETTVPETTVPETTVPETTVPETTVPDSDKVPDTGDHSNNALLFTLMGISVVGMAAALVLGHKMKYTGRWE